MVRVIAVVVSCLTDARGSQDTEFNAHNAAFPLYVKLDLVIVQAFDVSVFVCHRGYDSNQV